MKNHWTRGENRESVAFFPRAAHIPPAWSAEQLTTAGQAVPPNSSTDRGGSLHLEQTTASCSYTPTRMVTTKKTDKSRCWWCCEESKRSNLGLWNRTTTLENDRAISSKTKPSKSHYLGNRNIIISNFPKFILSRDVYISSPKDITIFKTVLLITTHIL